MEEASVAPTKVPWNKGKIVGQKAPLRLKDIWAIRTFGSIIEYQCRKNVRKDTIKACTVNKTSVDYNGSCYIPD